VGGDARDVPGQPVVVRERDHEVLAPLPHHRRDGDLSKIKAPGFGEREVVVEPP
jgi:hypothetical protein